ncbi:uncharacterized protein LOC121376810 [Gigantopelta aegis]|uniref:uncharacterized protein LOC121376810 n=1 Tax=Gigantopelta aegis TaxID=1735272 RepID=UPI001B8887B6|nr:uncharacterized protein LOC121376810 [Gigantopelta aegis]
MFHESRHLCCLPLAGVVEHECDVAPPVPPHDDLQDMGVRVQQVAREAGHGRELSLVVQASRPGVDRYEGQVPVVRHVPQCLDRRAARWKIITQRKNWARSPTTTRTGTWCAHS